MSLGRNKNTKSFATKTASAWLKHQARPPNGDVRAALGDHSWRGLHFVIRSVFLIRSADGSKKLPFATFIL